MVTPTDCRFVSTCAFWVLPLLIAGCTGADEAPVLKLAHATPPQSLIAISADEFAKRANDVLAGRAKVVVFGSGQLGGDEVVLQKLKLGTVDLAVPSTVMSAAVDEFALFELPYLIQDRDHVRRIDTTLFWSTLAPMAEREGLHVLALWENGFRHITNNVRPIVTPADLAGIKLRIPRSSWRARMFTSLGANPSPMPFSEVFLALQTGAIDGQENPLTNIVNARLDEVQSFLSLTYHVYSPAYLVAGADRWERLSSDMRDALESAARETQLFVFALAERMDAELLDTLRRRGMAVNEIDRARFREASRAVYGQFTGSVPGGDRLVEQALGLAR